MILFARVYVLLAFISAGTATYGQMGNITLKSYNITSILICRHGLNITATVDILNTSNTLNARNVHCNLYDIFLMSATQLNSDYVESDTPDQNLLRGSKAIADRIIFFDQGEIVEESYDAKAFFADPETDRAKRFLKSFDYN